MKKFAQPIYGLLTLLILMLPAFSAAQTNAPPDLTSSTLPTYYRPVQLSPSAYTPLYGSSLFYPKNGEAGDRTWSQTKSMFFYGIGAMGVIMLLPKDSTGWEESGGDLLKKWHENVKAGPEWDRNKWGYNYIGHAWVGGVYYQIARKSGYRQWDSFLYSALLSTFMWEYGVEAFAEVPSIQDVIYTPIAGWLYGEWAYQTEFKIRQNDNRVLGSKILGGTSLFLLDPVDVVGSGVNWMFGRQLVKAGYGYFTYMPVEKDGEIDHQVYLHVRIPIGPAGPSDDDEMKREFKQVDDPITTGIIGFGGGVGYTGMDNHWNVADGMYHKLNLGLYFTPRISMRLSYAFGDLKDKTTKETVEYENYSWDTQIYLLTKKKLRPYLSGGFGRQVRYEDNNDDTFQWNGGIGAHWQVHRKVALNADWINFYSPSRDTFDQQFNAGLIYRFGEGEHQNW